MTASLSAEGSLKARVAMEALTPAARGASLISSRFDARISNIRSLAVSAQRVNGLIQIHLVFFSKRRETPSRKKIRPPRPQAEWRQIAET